MNEPIKMGRPTKFIEEAAIKLEAAFNNGYNITEACQYSNISRDTYYNWIATKPEFSDRMEKAQLMLNRKAKEAVAMAIQGGDANLSFRYLERRDPDYKPKAEVDNNLGLQETRTKIKEFLDANSPNARSEQPAPEDRAGAGEEVPPVIADIS